MNDITHVSANFQKQLEMLSPYQLENLASVVNGDLILPLERKYRALPNLELWERLIDMCLVDSYDEMVIDLCRFGYEGRLTTNGSKPFVIRV